MKLNVKSRIGIAMTAVVLANAVAAAAVWQLDSQAADYAAEAGRASDKAAWVSTVSESVTEFISESNDLVLGFSAEDTSESSAEYGDVMGKDLDIANLLKTAPGDVSSQEIDSITAAWQELRLHVFVWSNVQAENAGSPTRLTLNEDDKVRASVDTNIAVPGELAGLGETELRRQVRSEEEAFRDRLLLGIEREANNAADTAQARMTEARSRATSVTIALVLAGLLVAGVAGVWLYRTIASPLKRAKDVADRVAEGDLGAQFPDHSDDEIGALVIAVERMRESVVGKVEILREMAGVLMVTADQVSEAAGQAQILTLDNDDGALQEVLADVNERATTLGNLSEQMLEA